MTFLGAKWQRELKDCALRRSRRSPKQPAVTLDYRAADRKAHPHSIRLRRKEGVEEMVETLWGNALAGVSHRDNHSV
jgi:hypothetical protein